MSAREWADSLTNISVGYLLSEASRAAHLDCAESSVNKDMAQIDEAAHSIDSFDATIAAHLSSANNVSLFGAEETRDGFSYEAACTSSLGFQRLRKVSFIMLLLKNYDNNTGYVTCIGLRVTCLNHPIILKCDEICVNLYRGNIWDLELCAQHVLML